MPQQGVAAARRIPDSKSRDGILIHAAVFEIRAPRFSFQGSFQLLDEEGLRFAMHFHERGALLIFFALSGRALLGPRNGNPAFLRDELHGLRKLSLFHVHHEVVDIAALAAPKAIKNLLDR